MTILYEVNIALDPNAVNEYLPWLRAHIRHIMGIPGFQRADVYRQLELHPDGRVGFTIQYFVRGAKELQDYLENHAPALRKDAEDKFGGRFTATRRTFQAHASYVASD